MKNIKKWMLFAMVLLFFDVRMGIVDCLPNWLAYLLLAACGKKIMEEKGSITAAIGIGAAVLEVLFSCFSVEHVMIKWICGGFFWTMEMLLFYGLATGILRLQEKEGLWIRRKILLLLYAISIVAWGMALNVRPMFVLAGMMLICARLYFLLGLWYRMPEAVEAKVNEKTKETP